MSFAFVAQESENDCALACLSMVYQTLFKTNLSLYLLKQKCHLTVNKGINLNDLIQLAENYAIKLTAYRFKNQALKSLKLKMPMIVQVKNSKNQFHFLVIYYQTAKRLTIADPSATGITSITFDEFFKIFTGIVIICDRLQQKQFKKQVINQVLQNKLNIANNSYFWFYNFHLFINNLFLIILFFWAQVIYKNLLAKVIIQNQLALVLLLLISFLVLNLLHSVLNFILAKCYYVLYFYVFATLKRQFFDHWFALLPQTSQQYRDSYYLQLFQDIANVSIVYSNNILELCINFLTFCCATFWLIKINFQLWVLIMLSGFLNLLISWSFMMLQKPKILKNTQLLMQFHQQIISVSQNFADYYYRNLLVIKQQQLLQQQETLQNSEITLKNLNVNSSFFHNLLHHIANFAVMYLMITLVYNQKLEISQMLFVNTLSMYLFAFFYQVGDFCYFYPEFQKSWNRLNVFLNLPIKTQVTTGDQKILGYLTELQFSNVTWGFKNQLIFKNLNLIINHHHLLLGANGIGKTTLLYLIARKYQPLSGQILINQQHLEKVSNQKWQNLCLYLSSNSQLLNGTILDNLFAFDFNTVKWNKLKQLQIVEILAIFELNLSVEYSIEQDNLSQGQKQIVLFLSIFFHDWKILLLDEVLSNVVTEIKLKLIAMLRSHFANALIVISSHDQTLYSAFNAKIDLHQLGCNESK